MAGFTCPCSMRRFPIFVSIWAHEMTAEFNVVASNAASKWLVCNETLWRNSFRQFVNWHLLSRSLRNVLMLLLQRRLAQLSLNRRQFFTKFRQCGPDRIQ